MAKLALTLIFAFLIPAHSFAWNEPDGFRGIRWETDIAELGKGWEETDHDQHGDGVKLYARSGDPLNIGDAEIRPPRYGFYKGKFYYVLMRFDSLSNFQKIKETLLAAYGEDSRPIRQRDRFGWIGLGNTINISLEFNTLKRTGTLYYQYIPIQKQKETEMKEKAKGAVKDL